jgi:pilus assembly protein CpaE
MVLNLPRSWVVANILRTVVVDADLEERAVVRELCGGLPVALVGEFATVSEALIEAPLRRADVVLVRTTSAADEQRALRAVEVLGRTLTDSSIIVIDSDYSADAVIAMVRAGAVELLRWPVEAGALAAAFETVQRARRRTPPTRPVGDIIAVFSAKGGLGATTVATNVAVLLAQRKSGGTTLLVELDGRPSDVTTLLNVHARYSVLDAFRNVDRLDESFLRGLVTRHESGLWVLPGPTQFEPFTATADQVRHALGVVRSHFDHVVLDLRHEPDPATLAALTTADTVLFPTSLNVAALRAGATALSTLRDAGGLDLAQVRILVMRAGAAEDVTLKQAEETLQARIVASIEYDYAAVTAASNTGEPLVTRSPRSKASKSLRELVAALGPSAVPSVAPGPRRSAMAQLRQAFARPAGAGK